MRVLSSAILLSLTLACTPNKAPDKTIAGAVLGASWGAGGGAIIGNQVNATGEGAAIGAGFGLVSGTLAGAGLDTVDSADVRHKKELDSFKVHAPPNRRRLASLQAQLDDRERKLSTVSTLEEVYFEDGKASLRLGAARKLQEFAEKIKNNPYATKVVLHGHANSIGNVDREIQLSEARVRTVATFLAGQGVPLDQMRLVAHGANRPIAADNQALNRRVEVILTQ